MFFFSSCHFEHGFISWQKKLSKLTILRFQHPTLGLSIPALVRRPVFGGSLSFWIPDRVFIFVFGFEQIHLSHLWGKTFMLIVVVIRMNWSVSMSPHHHLGWSNSGSNKNSNSPFTSMLKKTNKSHPWQLYGEWICSYHIREHFVKQLNVWLPAIHKAGHHLIDTQPSF